MDSTLDLDFICLVPSDAVKNVKAITEALYQGQDLRLIRNAIADLMDQQLKRGEATGRKAALPYFADALGALTINVDSQQRSSPVGIYLCLLDLENAIAILDGTKTPNFSTTTVEQLSYTFLIEALEAIRQSPSFKMDVDHIKQDTTGR